MGSLVIIVLLLLAGKPIYCKSIINPLSNNFRFLGISANKLKKFSRL